MFPILVGQAYPFKETLKWLQLAYTADRIGSYVTPSSTVFVPSAVSEGYPLSPAFWRNLLRRFPGYHTPTTTTRGPPGSDYLGYPEVVPPPATLVPLGPDYFNVYQGFGRLSAGERGYPSVMVGHVL